MNASWLRFPIFKKKGAIPDDLEPHIAILRNIINSTEKEFLLIGENVQEFYSRANDISGSASDVAKKISGREMDAVREGFKNMSSLVDRLSGDMQSEKDAIFRILSHFKDLEQPLTEFENVVRILNVLSNFIKIEIAHLALSDTSFLKLSQDVQQMAKAIENKIASLADQTQSAIPSLQNNARLIEDCSSRQQSQSRQILESVGVSLASISDKYDESIKTIQQIRDTWESITDHVGVVIQSLQFHDITRQRLEHVVEALDELPLKLRALTGRKSMARGDAIPHSDRLHSGELIAHTFELQAAQLQGARQDVMDAVGRIDENLRLVARDAASISEKIYSATGPGDGRESESFVTGLEKGILNLAESADEMARLKKDLASAMSVMSKTAEGMSVFAKDMQVIGIEMQRLALNARVHAAHLGDEGVTLGVLANSIHQMSLDTTSKVSAVTVHLQTVVENAARLSGMAGAQGQESESGRDNIRGQFLGLSDPLKEIETEIGRLLMHIEKSGKELSADIEHLLDGVQVHKTVSAAVEKVESYLNACVERMGVGQTEEHLQRKAKMLEDLSSRYTMQRERKTHDASVGENGAKPKPPAPDAIPSAAKPAEKPAEEDLGDNVELF